MLEGFMVEYELSRATGIEAAMSGPFESRQAAESFVMALVGLSGFISAVIAPAEAEPVTK